MPFESRHPRITAMRALDLLLELKAAEALARRDGHHAEANLFERVGDVLTHHLFPSPSVHLDASALPAEPELLAAHAAIERLCRHQHMVSGIATTPRVGAPPGSKTRWTVARDGGRLP